MKIKSILLIITCLIQGLNILPTFSQQPVFKSFDIRTENTRPRILKLLLDHNGRIWTGTDKGVFTFDGINFSKVYSSDTSKSIVCALFEDKLFCIWAGFENGKIICIKNQTVIPFNPEEGFPKVAISSFTEDNEGRIYFSTKGEGIYCIEKNRTYNINHDDGLSDDYCYGMIKFPDQRMCVATDAGLNFVSFANGKKTISRLGTSEGLPDDIVRALDFDKNEILWIGLQEKGIAKFDFNKNKLTSVHLKEPWNYGQINNILNVDDQLYVATEDKGIVVIDPRGFSSILTLDDDRNIKSNDLLLDVENNVWIAESIHLFRTSGNKISFLPAIDNKTLKFIHCIVCDKNGSLWFSPDKQLGQIYQTADGQLKYKEYSVLKKQVDIVTLYIDPYGFIWIGTLGAGVYRFNPANGKVRKVTETTDATNSSILSINGSGDVVWVAGFNSVMKFIIRMNGNSDEAIIKKEPAFNESKLLKDYVYSVFIDSKGRPWFATDGNGVYFYDGKNLNNIPVYENAVHSFTEDKKGRIWFSTADAGLQYLDTDQKIKNFQTKDGLSDPSPTSLICTKTGNIIVINSNGFDVLNPDTKSIIYHSSEETLADINCDLNSVAISPDSSIWMGTERGILQYRPSSDMKLQRPKIVLQSVSMFLKAIDFHNQNKFKADENNFRFDYDGLWYIDPQRINYLFLLDGYSSKWVSTKDHTVTFPKLPPGKYTFRIKASLNSNFEHVEEASYSFEIMPHIWQRWWFRISIAGIIALLILFMIRRREDRLRKFDRLQKEKIEFQFETLKSQVNPHFLFNSFNTLISVIENTPKNAIEYVERLSEFFRNIVTYRDKNLISVAEELSVLDNYIFIQKKRYGDNLRLDILLDENTRTRNCLAPLTLQLLAENAIKHNAVSKESPLIITITSENDKMIIGNNINPKIARESSVGFGLQNIKSRYELLTDEKVEIIREEKKFIVKIPLIQFKHERFNY